jgi:hypothetical protein
MAKEGDVAGVLAHLREKSLLHLPDSAMNDLVSAIRALQRKDPDALVNWAYAELVGAVSTLLARCLLHVERRIAESDAHGGNQFHLPPDLIDEGWTQRVEGLTRFFMELTSMRERVRHMARLHANETSTKPIKNWVSRMPLGDNRSQAPQGAVPPYNGGYDPAAKRFEFP